MSCLTQEDNEKFEQRAERMTQISNIKSIGGFFRWLGSTTGILIQNSLEMGAFFIQFFDWYYSNNATKVKIFASNDIPPPPLQVSFLIIIL